MKARSVGKAEVYEFIASVFEEDMHAKRVLSLSNATVGVIHAGALAVHAIGRGLAVAQNSSKEHGVKQVDRLLGNEGVKPWELFPSWVRFVVSERKEIVVPLDWTDFEKDDQATLVASMLTSHGRPTPLMWMSVKKSELKGIRNDCEDSLLLRLKQCLPPGVRVTILADRGFGWRRSVESAGFRSRWARPLASANPRNVDDRIVPEPALIQIAIPRFLKIVPSRPARELRFRPTRPTRGRSRLSNSPSSS